MNNRYISNLSQDEWATFKHKNRSTLLNTYPDYDFEARLKVMKDFKKVLNEENITLYLADGALLGAYRDKDFISWDPDVDMHVLDEEFRDKYETIRGRFIELGYLVRGVLEAPRSKINIYYAGEKIGITSLYLEGATRYRGIFEWPADLYEDNEKVIFRGVEFDAPSIERYLIHQYGEDWRIPKKQDYFSKAIYRTPR